MGPRSAIRPSAKSTRGSRCACSGCGCTFWWPVRHSTCTPAWPQPAAWHRSRNEQRPMRILDRSVYVGPSLHAHFPVIRLALDLGPLEAWPTGRLGGGFVDALALALPGLAE